MFNRSGACGGNLMISRYFQAPEIDAMHADPFAALAALKRASHASLTSQPLTTSAQHLMRLPNSRYRRAKFGKPARYIGTAAALRDSWVSAPRVARCIACEPVKIN
jgi:hypothetical protein